MSLFKLSLSYLIILDFKADCLNFYLYSWPDNIFFWLDFWKIWTKYFQQHVNSIFLALSGIKFFFKFKYWKQFDLLSFSQLFLIINSLTANTYLIKPTSTNDLVSWTGLLFCNTYDKVLRFCRRWRASFNISVID